jgi:streptogramin lyase
MSAVPDRAAGSRAPSAPHPLTSRPAGRRAARALLAAAAVAMLPVSASHAAVVQTITGFNSPTSGIALTPDGTVWVTEPAAGTAARVATNGAILGHMTIGGDPSGIATGPSGSIWITLPSSKKIVKIANPAAQAGMTTVSTGGLSTCGPTAIVDGGNGQMYFSMPRDGVCSSADLLGSVPAATASGPQSFADRGRAMDLAVGGGKLFVPDDDGQVIRRLALDDSLTVESTVAAPGSTMPESVALVGSDVYVGLSVAGPIARFPAAQDGGSAVALPPSRGFLTTPLALAPFGSGVLAAGSDSANVATLGADGSYVFTALIGARPLDVVAGTDGDAWITDGAAPQIFHYVDGAPRLWPGSASVTASGAVDFLGQVETRGNDTQVVVDYGPTTDYGQTSAQVSVPGGLAPTTPPIALAGLRPATTYHARMRATNLRGSVLGQDVTFRTPAAQVVAHASKPARLAAHATFRSSSSRTATRITSLRLVGLSGGEHARVTCSSKRKGCSFATRRYASLKKGTRNLSALFGARRKLKPGVKISVAITKPGLVGTSAVLTTRAGRAPRIVRRCLAPGAKKPTAC